MKLFKLHREIGQPTYGTLVVEANTGDRITLFHGESMPDEYVVSTQGVFHQHGNRIFRNDDQEPTYTGTCESFFDNDGDLIILKCSRNRGRLFHIQNGTLLLLYTLSGLCDSVHVVSFFGEGIFVQHGEQIIDIDLDRSLLEKPVDRWGVNRDGCIVQQHGRLWRVMTPRELAPYSTLNKITNWHAYDNGVVVAVRGQGLFTFDGKTTELLASRVPKEWCVTQSGKVIKLENNTFSTLNDHLVYDGPFYDWRPHPHGVLIERDGDLVLAVVK